MPRIPGLGLVQIRALRVLLLGLALLGLVPVGSAQWVTQTLQLQNGWNAVHLRVQPFPASCDQLFSNTPVTQVFRYNARMMATQFGTDPTQPWKRPDEWLVWVPSGDELAYVRTLVNVVGGTAYLIKSTNAWTLTLKGRPAIPRFNWVPGQPNLVGFQLTPIVDSRPTFANFFRYEPAVDGAPSFDKTNIVQIGLNLETTNLTPQTAFRKIDPDVAYWIRAQAPSDFIGPVRISTTDPEGLAYGTRMNELELRLLNACDSNPAPVVVTLRHVISEAPPADAPPLAGTVPLLYADRTATNWIWRPWPIDQSQNWSLTNGQLLSLRLAINRSAMSPPAETNALWQSLLRLSADGGAYAHIPLSAACDSGTDQLAAFPYGLWVGQANINEVSCARFSTNSSGEEATVSLRKRFLMVA
ncbi:MAG TPA: hypothetical protein P5205_15945 [Candidatus Paceibacterota bacterium]|nr:hypothetical protein [Candidatus Paceibacterota bacterium]